MFTYDNLSDDDNNNDIHSNISNNNEFVIGTNGALSHATSVNVILDLSFILNRGLEESQIEFHYKRILAYNNVNQMVDFFLLTFVTRNCRGGKGEKDLFYKMFSLLYSTFPDTCDKLVKLIPLYGSWKDLFTFVSKFKRIVGINRDMNVRLLTDTVIFTQPNTKIVKYDKMLHSHSYLINPFDQISNVFAEQIIQDLQDLHEKGSGANISLAAKWAPRENGEFAKLHRKFFMRLVWKISSLSNLNSTKLLEKEKKISDGKILAIYRKIISKLSNHLDVVERKMSSNHYRNINYSTIPSLALSKFRMAHLNLIKNVPCNDDIRGNRYPDREDRVIGRTNLLLRIKQKKVKGTQIQPHNIVNDILSNKLTIKEDEIELLSAQWSDMVQRLTIIDRKKKFIPVCDVSGSMSSMSIGSSKSSKIIPLHVCIALGIILSELAPPSFQNSVITFSDNPEWVNLSNLSLQEKIHTLKESNWSQSTNLLKTFQMILDIVILFNIQQEDIPDIVIFSDMQFNEAVRGSGDTTFVEINNMYKCAGFTPPGLVFWNLNTLPGLPVMGNTPNTSLLSGFSPALFKYITTGDLESITPEITLRAMLDDEMYDPIKQILLESNEGILSTYNYLM